MNAAFTLTSDEVELRRWTISWRSFLIRCAAMFAATLVLLSPLMLFGGVFGFVTGIFSYITVGLILTPCLMWMFDDFKIWRDNRDTVWMLSNHALHIQGRDADEAIDLRMPLQEVRSIAPWPYWSLVLRLENGTAITLPLVPNSPSLRRAILDARANVVSK